MKQVSRRSFNRAAAITGLTALSYRHVYGANDRVGLGFIGCGNRGDELLDSFLQVGRECRPLAYCDLSDAYVRHAHNKAGGTGHFYKDYRELLQKKEVDAVVIATPDHWHALQTIEACSAGKDVYIEKPLSLCVAEGRAMVEAAAKHQRIVQVGIHRRSSPLCRDAVEAVQRGEIGEIVMCRAFHIQNEWPEGIGSPSDSKPPENFDWERWLGPAPMKPYNVNRTFYRFRWFYDYSGGQLSNFGAHYLDLFHWMMKQNAPATVAALGGKYFVKDNREIPDTLEVIWQYPKNLTVTFTQLNANGALAVSQPETEVEIRGTKGTLYLQGKNYLILPETTKPIPFPALSPIDRESIRKYRAAGKPAMTGVRKSEKAGANDTTRHALNFIECVKSRKEPNCSIETGHRATSAALIGRIALQKRAILDWDDKAEKFTNSAEANSLLRYEYRAPYKFPG
jgi:predicted dehydrogenase